MALYRGQLSLDTSTQVEWSQYAENQGACTLCYVMQRLHGAVSGAMKISWEIRNCNFMNKANSLA